MPVTELLHHPLLEGAAQAQHEGDYKQHVNYTMSGAESLDVIITEDVGSNGITGNGGSSSLNVTLPANCLLDRNILLEVTVIVRPNAGGGKLGGYFVPRQWPLASAMNNLSLQVNNITMTDAPASYASVFGRYKSTQDYFKKYRSLTPCQPDKYNRYESYSLAGSYDGIHGGGGPAVPGGLEYYSSIFDSEDSNSMMSDDVETRGAFPFVCSDLTDEADANRTYTFTEPLLHSFCVNREGSGVAHVRTLAVQINWGKIERMFSQINSVTNQPFDTDIAHTVINPAAHPTPNLDEGANSTFTITKVRLLTKIAMPSIPIVPRHEIGYNDFKFYTQSVDVAAATGKCSVQFNNISLGTVPSHVFIYVRQKAADKTRFDADGYLAVDKLSLTVGGRPGNLVNWTPRHLYLASVENGVNMSWKMFSQTLGSVICLGFGKDIPGILPGLRRTIDFSFTGEFTNTTYFDHSGFTLPLDKDQVIQTYKWEACCLFVTPAVLTVEESLASEVVGITEAEAQETLNDGPSHDSHETAMEPVGGSVGSWLRRNFKKGIHLVKRFAPVLNAAAAVVPGAAPVINAITKGADIASGVVGEGLSRHKRLHSRMGRGLLMN